MPANVETAVYANAPAWHGEGIVRYTADNPGLTIDEAFEDSGLGAWAVEKVPVFAFKPGAFEYVRDAKGNIDFAKTFAKIAEDAKAGRGFDLSQIVPSTDRFGVQRDTPDGRLFGTVGKTWWPTQYRDGFKIVDDVIQQAGGKTWIESAGVLDDGKKAWVLVHVDKGLQIAGESYHEYMLFVNGHDGRTSITCCMTNVRVVCENTLALALQTAERVVRVRHTTKAGERVKEAAAVLGLRDVYAEQLAIQGEFLAEQTMSDAQFEKFLASLMPCEHEAGTPAHTMITDRRGDVAQVYMQAPNLQPIRGTRWGALQAVVEYSDYGREFRNNQTALANQFGLVGTGTALKDRAFAILKTKQLALAS